ncbi:hypothetical protein BU23DRAFT_635675 [Bimuria novae-zelandiae CBS 107.79]|uniref:Uncharacterized protein n=1 Tax=Bimuria novae-zelandiae CBS 107.79 TaxID=1447943 RepID=A0A6A5VEM0_9PLEO|nr:hypothetical protein BU23DRAFT_635675 [Bimuria novae-zelandiae CBS 107.79]
MGFSLAFNFIIISVLCLVTVIGSIVWLAKVNLQGYHKIGFTSRVIGGKLSQGQAKAVDVVCSAVLALLLLATVNYFWFATLRVITVYESNRGTSLNATITASSMTSGTYNAFVLTRLFTSGQLKLCLFAVVLFLAAISKSALSNIIAYEAFDSPMDTHVTLEPSVGISLNGSWFDSGRYNYTPKQYAGFASQTLAMLIDLELSEPRNRLENDGGYYIGIDSTTSSVNSLPANLVDLYNIPGYRLSIDCIAKAPETLGVIQMGESSYTINVNVNMTDSATPMLFNSEIPGQTSSLTGAYNEEYPFVSFGMQGVYLGFLDSFNLTGSSNETAFGNMTYSAFNMAGMGAFPGSDGFSGTKSIISVHGLHCQIFRESGLHNLTREANQPWRRGSSQYSGEKHQFVLMISDWQKKLNYHSINGTIAGYGPPLSSSSQICQTLPNNNCTFDYKDLAENFLYAAGEVERIAFEAKGTDLDRETIDTIAYSVDATSTEQRYRITYVPAILLVAMVRIRVASIIPLVLFLMYCQTPAVKHWKVAHPLRLLVDAVDGLRHDTKTQDVHHMTDAELETWAKKVKISYVRGQTGDEMVLKAY